MRRLVFPAVAMLLGTLGTLAVLEVVFQVLPVAEDLRIQAVDARHPFRRFEPDRDVVWSIGPGLAHATLKHVNNWGFTNDQDYHPEVRSRLLAVIGDSYVEALQVANRDALQGVLATRVRTLGRVYSFGVSGAQLPTYLAYARHAAETFRPDALVFVIIGNDFDESMRGYGTMAGYHHFVRGADGELDTVLDEYVPSRARRLAKRSALLRYLSVNLRLREVVDPLLWGIRYDCVGNTDAAASDTRVEDSRLAVREFLRRLPDAAGLPADRVVFLVDGLRPQLYDPEDLAKTAGAYFSVMREYFMSTASAAGFEVVDLQPWFLRRHAETGERFEFEDDAHWNENGHLVAAEAVAASRVFGSLFPEVPRAHEELEIPVQ